jgi:hypothetical protein
MEPLYDLSQEASFSAVWFSAVLWSRILINLDPKLFAYPDPIITLDLAPDPILL